MQKFDYYDRIRIDKRYGTVVGIKSDWYNISNPFRGYAVEPMYFIHGYYVRFDDVSPDEEPEYISADASRAAVRV